MAGPGAVGTQGRSPWRWEDLRPRVVTVALAWPLILTALLVGPAWLPALIWAPVVFLAAREARRLIAAGWPDRGRFPRAAAAIVIGVLLPSLFPLLRVLHGAEAALLALAVSWGGDCGAYLTGRLFGRHRIATRISPRKTWEGALGSLATAILLAALIRAFGLVPHAPGAFLLLVVPANLLAQFGDLAESALKRRAGARHSGRLIPGGGGVLDAVDGLSMASLGLIVFF